MHNLLGVTVLLAVAGSCDPAQFKNPLVEPTQSKTDPRLTGTWAARDESAEFMLFVQPVPPGKTDVTLVARAPSDGVVNVSWRGVTSSVGGKTYLNLQEKVFTDNLDNKYEVKPTFMVVRYELKGNALKLSYLTNEGLGATPELTTADSATVASTIEKLPATSFQHFQTFKRVKLP